VLFGRVVVARTFTARLRGLMGRARLDDDEGLYLPGDTGIHMLFMRFPIDCLFVTRPDGTGALQVVDIREHLRPWTGLVVRVAGAQGAIELPASSVRERGVRVGDLLRISPWP